MPTTTRTPSGLRFDSMVNLGFEFSPTMALSAKAFQALGADIRSFREPLKRSIQRVIAPSIGQNFISNGRPEGWEPYADDTVRMKMNDPNNKFGPENMLRRSGLLWKTMQQFNIWAVTQNQAAILQLPQKIWYGQIHQAGFGMRASDVTPASGMFLSPAELKALGSKGRTYIPARPFVMFQDRDIDAVQEVFADWLQERVDAKLAGFKIIHGKVTRG